MCDLTAAGWTDLQNVKFNSPDLTGAGSTDLPDLTGTGSTVESNTPVLTGDTSTDLQNAGFNLPYLTVAGSDPKNVESNSPNITGAS